MRSYFGNMNPLLLKFPIATQTYLDLAESVIPLLSHREPIQVIYAVAKPGDGP